MDVFFRISGFIFGCIILFAEYICNVHYPVHGILWVVYGVWFLVGFLMVTACSGIDWSDFFLFDALGDIIDSIFSSID